MQDAKGAVQASKMNAVQDAEGVASREASATPGDTPASVLGKPAAELFENRALVLNELYAV